MSSSQPETVVGDFLEVLRLPGPDGLPRIILAGQAVNVWADRYLAVEPGLREFLPFTSKDLDLLGDRWDLDALARATGWPKRPAQQKIFIPSAGFLEMPRQGRAPVKVEVLKRLYGVTTEEIRSAALVIEHEGVQLRVVHPISLLEAKLHNAIHLPQQARHDVKHLKMMVLCVRGFLREKLVDVQAGRLSERDCVGLCEKVLRLADSRTAAQAAKRHGINWTDALPLKELNESTHTRLRNFAHKRLKRWMEAQETRP